MLTSLSLLAVSLLILVLCGVSTMRWWISSESDVEILEHRPCICGRVVQPNEPYRWSPAGDRLIHDWCIPVEVSVGGEWAVNDWLRRNDILNARSAGR